MPSTYAHYRLGKALVPQLPADVQQCIQRFRRMYDMGLQGPDFFFYHNPFVKTAAGELGHRFHSQTGREFFERACKAASSEAAKAYLYGLLAHYVLDSGSHPFVIKKDAAGEGKHVPMEKEFDRFLMEMDAIASPHIYPLGDRIRLTRGECVTVAAFYPGSEASQVNSSVKFMSVALNFLAKQNQGLTGRLIRRFRPELLEHAIPQATGKDSLRTNSELLARYNRALRDYPSLLQQLTAHMASGQELGPEFDPTFG